MLGKMLTHVLKLGEDEIYLSSIIKCRVPEDAQPDLMQVRTCTPFLLNQLAVVQPKIICTMGQLAAQTLLKTREPLIKLRGRFHEVDGIPLMPTFHPSYLIKTPEMKQAALRDLQMIRERLDL
jgi:DNA polymerase